jgi:integrase/recombinase XerD
MSHLADLVNRSEYLLPATKSAYRAALRRFERYASENPALYSAATVEAFRDYLSAHELSPATVNKHVYAVRWASRRLAQLGHGSDFAAGAEGVRVPARLHRRALTLAEVRAVLAEVADVRDPACARDRALIVCGLRTGLRISELCRMTFGDVSAGIVRGRGKGDKELAAVIDPEAGAVLADWRGWLSAHRVACSAGPVFRPIHEGMTRFHIGDRPISRVTAHRIISGRGKTAGVKLSAHLLRHTFVTWALEAGVPPWRIMRQTGHAAMETLMKYAHDTKAAKDPVGGYLPSVL